MTRHLLPMLYTLFVWWFGTVAILYLDGLPRWTHKWTMFWASVLLAIALVGLAATAGDTRSSGAYIAFTCTIVIWAWKELAFLMGFVTGPRRAACPPGARGWPRVGYALMAILYHELALVLLGAAVIAVTWGAANPVAACTFATLWLMRLSAKVNVFLGVRNLNEEFLPDAVRYIGSYFRQRNMNRLFPVSLMVSGALALLLWDHALAVSTGSFGAVSSTIVATLISLALLEHGLMMLPLPSQWLWRWGMKSRELQPVETAGPG